MGRLFRSPPTFNVKIRADDRSKIESLKRHPRETFGDVVHWLVTTEVARRGLASAQTRENAEGVVA